MNDSRSDRLNILEALQRCSRVIASHRAYSRALRAVKFFLGAIFGMALLDIVLHLSPLPRVVLLMALGVALLGLALLCLHTVFFRRPTLDATARDLEMRDPALGSKLTNVLQLDAQAQNPESAPLTRDLARRAIDQCGSEVQPASLPPLARCPLLKRDLGTATAFCGAFALLVLLLGQPAYRQLARLLDPYGDHPPLSFSWLEITYPIEDGVEIVYGESAKVEVKVSGHELQDVILEVTPRNGSGAPRELPMSAVDSETFVAMLDNVREPLTLVARSKNGRSISPRRDLAVELIPQLTGAELTISPPAYTGLPDRKQQFRFAGLQALEGSTLTFRLQSNRPLGTGELIVVLPAAEPTEQRTILAPLEGGADNEALAKLVISDSGTLTFELRDIENRRPEVAPISALTVSRDLPPAIAIISPETDSFVVEGHELELGITASDDYGLRQIRSFIAINDQFEEPLDTSFDGVGPRSESFAHTLSLSDLDAAPGDVITLSAEAIDNCPTPHLSRTEPRRLQIISESQYNDFLRKQTDVAQIAGKYEDLLRRFEELVEQQGNLAENRAPQDEQEDLNEQLEQIAKEMEDFGRENPVYDFEKNLQRELDQMAQNVRSSIAQNEADQQQARESAAQDHYDRLANEQEHGNSQIEQPLEDLALMHELMKDFNEFKMLHEEQIALKEATRRFENTPDLQVQDRLSLQQLAPRQREVTRALDELVRKLQHHADLAEEKFPKAAKSARDLAAGIERGSFPRLGRQSSQAMVSADGPLSHERAANLEAEMAKLIKECQGGCAACESEGLDRYLQIPGRSPGNSFAQMMQSLNFSPFGSSGGSGSGMSGSMATGGIAGGMPTLVGGESMLPGAIAGKMSGRQGGGAGRGQGGSAIANIDRTEDAGDSLSSTRQTETPEGQNILIEYQDITDAYFRTLTQPE